MPPSGKSLFSYKITKKKNLEIHNLYFFHFRNKRKIMRIFTLPPTVEMPPEPNFYDSMKKIRLRQQLEMYSIGKDMSFLKTFY